VRRRTLAGLVAAGSVIAAVAAGWVRLAAAVPPLQAAVHVPASLVLPGGPPPPVTLPGVGSLDVEADVPGDAPERIAGLAGDVVRPIGSVAKTMTALAVLEAHPLAAGEEGPALTMTDADVALFHQAVSVDGSALPVQAGQRLTERQLLLGLMLPSANNLAETLGGWVSGGHDAFVVRLNAMAQRLAMARTHFDDPSGYSPRTVSSAGDLVRLGRAALAVPALAAIVGTSEAPFPDGSTLHNLDALLGSVPGWLGIKTGETPSAGGCLLFAAQRRLGGASRPVTVVGAVLGQPHLADALAAAQAAVESTFDGYVAVRVADLDPPLTGAVHSPWGDTAGVLLAPGEGTQVVLRRRAPVQLATLPRRLPAELGTGDTVAWIEARSGTALIARWRVMTTTHLGPAPLLWRLLHR
jgi:D-alanyl-D-alanine carboxypeptidase (penicillin-binding protein 5/6)